MNDLAPRVERAACERAYRQAHYRIHEAGESFTLLIDQPSAVLRQCHVRHGVNASAFMTAWNPYSVLCDEHVNARAHAHLLADLRTAGFAYLSAEALDSTEQWPIERGLLVLGVSQADALMLGTRYQQNAVVCCDEGGTPRLQWCTS